VKKTDPLDPPAGYTWVTKFVDDEEYGWNAVATLRPTGTTAVKRRWYQPYTIPDGSFSGSACNYTYGPDELMESAKKSALDRYDIEQRRLARDAEFRARVKAGTQ
jgi:hypothetical protein